MIYEPFINRTTGEIAWCKGIEDAGGHPWQQYTCFEREKLKALGLARISIHPHSGYWITCNRHNWFSENVIGYSTEQHWSDSESSRLLKRADFLKSVCEKEGVEWLPSDGGYILPPNLPDWVRKRLAKDVRKVASEASKKGIDIVQVLVEEPSRHEFLLNDWREPCGKCGKRIFWPNSVCTEDVRSPRSMAETCDHEFLPHANPESYGACWLRTCKCDTCRKCGSRKSQIQVESREETPHDFPDDCCGPCKTCGKRMTWPVKKDCSEDLLKGRGDAPIKVVIPANCNGCKGVYPSDEVNAHGLCKQCEPTPESEEREWRKTVLEVLRHIVNAVNANKEWNGMGVEFAEEELRKRFISEATGRD